MSYRREETMKELRALANSDAQDIILNIPRFFHEFTPKLLGRFSMKSPEVAKIFFEKLETDEILLEIYRKQSTKFFDSIRCLLKINANIFLDIVEKYFEIHRFKKFYRKATKYVLRTQRNRFNMKLELYVAQLLDMKTIAPLLTHEEIKEVIRKLAKAKYLEAWFSYKNVEPMLKALGFEERKVIKKEIFIDKSFGETVEDWPYELPSTPELKTVKIKIFEDKSQQVFHSCAWRSGRGKKLKIKKRKGGKFESCFMKCDIIEECAQKSNLQLLFDKYRFVSFGKTFFELRNELAFRDTQGRQDIMLVLVGKSGGAADNLERLLTLLVERHMNEPVNLRAAVVRSAVKRGQSWRLPESTWNLLKQFLSDGKHLCIEFIHCVILRRLLAGETCLEDEWEAFLKHFTSLAEYKLNSNERRVVSTSLPTLLAKKADGSSSFRNLHLALDTLSDFHIPATQIPEVIAKAVDVVKRDPQEPSCLLLRLYRAKIARRELFMENFSVIQTDESYLNALKHDPSILSSGKEFEELVRTKKIKHERFLRALATFSGEPKDLRERYFNILLKYARETPRKELARPIALLAGPKLPEIWHELDLDENKEAKKLAAALRANLHLAYGIDKQTLQWSTIGVQAIANMVTVCEAKDADMHIARLLSWHKTQRLALALSMKFGKEVSTFAAVASTNPKLVLKTVLQHNHRLANEPKIWEIVCSILTNGVSVLDDKFYDKIDLENAMVHPIHRATYFPIVYHILRKISFERALAALSRINDILPEICANEIDKILTDFFNDFYKVVDYEEYSLESQNVTIHVTILAKYILLSKTDEENIKRVSLLKMFFDQTMIFWKDKEIRNIVNDYLDNFLSELKYHGAFFSDSCNNVMCVFESVIELMKMFLPVEIFFEKYAFQHLTMLYYKAIRQAVKNNALLFKDLQNNHGNNVIQAVNAVGVIFGKFIASELKVLMGHYFESIISIYGGILMKYIRQSFHCYAGLQLIMLAILDGILESKSLQSYMLTVQILKEENTNDAVIHKAVPLLKECPYKEVRFVFYAELSYLL